MILEHLRAKRESISSHVAWGAVVSMAVGGGLQGAVVALCVGFAWEVGSGIFTRGEWKPSLLDLPPWVVGGLLGALL